MAQEVGEMKSERKVVESQRTQRQKNVFVGSVRFNKQGTENKEKLGKKKPS